MIVDIHPEDLIDKCAASELTLPEQERLEAHLAQCASCRFEIAVRGDFAVDTAFVGTRPRLGLETSSAALPDAFLALDREAADSHPSRSLRARARRRWPVVLLAASFILCAGGAAAAVLTGSVPSAWIPWSPQPKSDRVASASARAQRARGAHARTNAAPNQALSSEAATLPPAPLTPTAEVVSAEAVPEAAAVARAITHTPPGKSSAVRAAPPSSGDSVPVARPEPVRASPSPSEPSAQPVETPAHGADAAGSLFAEANRARREGNADRAALLYRSLQSRYPNSAESDLSRAVLAQMQLERGSPDAALAGFDRYLAGGSTALSAEALVGRARALEQLGKREQAVAAWSLVQRRFAGSVHAQLAATRLAALGMR